MRRILPLLLIALLLGTGWLAWIDQGQDMAPIDRSGQPLPDYTLSGLTLRQYGEHGQLDRVLKAGYLEHIAQQGTRLTKPELTVTSRDGGAPWVIRGATGRVDPTGTRLTLPDDAVIIRAATPANRPLHLKTRNLSYRLDQGYAQTDEAVTVTSDRDRIHAVGLQAWLQDPARIHFKSQVRGHYEP